MMSRHWQPLQIFFVIDLILGMVCSNENPPVIRDNKALELAREPNLGNIFNFGESFGSRLQTMQSDESSQFTVIDAEFLLGLFKNKTSLGENEKSKSSITPEARDFTGIGRPKTFLPPNQKRRRRLFKKSHNKTQDHLSSNPNLFAREGGVNEFGPNSHNVSPLPHRLKKGRSFSISTTKRPLTLVPLVYKPGPAVIRVFPNPEDVKLAGLVSRNENKALKKGQLLDHASQMEILKVKENLPLKILEENGKIQATSIKPKSIFGHTNLQEYGFSDGDNMALYVESSYNPTYTVPPRFHFVKGDFTNLEFRKYNVSTPNNEVKLQGRSDDADIQQARLIMSSPLSDILRLSPTSSSFIHPTSPPPYFLADTLGHGENSKTPISGRPSLRPHVPNDVINDPLSSRPEFHGIMNNQFSHQPNIHRDMHRSQLPVSRHAQNEIPEQPFPLRPPPLPNKRFPAKPLAPGLRQDQSHSSTPLNTLARNQLLSRPPFTGAFGEQLPVKPTSHDVPHSRITLSSSNPQIIHQDQLTLKPFPHDTRQNFSPLRDLPFPPGVHQDILKDSRKPFVPISTSPPHPEPHKTDTLSTLPPSLPSSPRPHGPLSLHRSVKAFEPPTVRYSSYQSAISNNDHFHEVGDLHHQSLSYSSIPPLPSLSESTSIRPFSLPITGDPTTLQTHSDPPTTQFRHMEKPPEMLFADPFDDHNFLKESVDPSSVIYFTFQPEDLSPTNPDFTSIPPIHHDEEKLNPPVSPPSELQLSHPSDFPVFHESLKTSLPPFTQTPSPIPSSSYSTHSPPPVSSTFPPPPIFPSSPPPFSSTHPPSFHSTSPHPPPSPPTPPSPPPPPPSPPPPTSSHPPISTYSSPLPLSFHSSSPRPSTPFTSSHPPSFPSTSIPPPPPPRYPSSRPPTFHTTTLSPPPLPIFPSSRPPPFHSTSLPPPPPPYFPSSRPPTFHSTSLLPPNFPSSHPPSVHSTTHLPPPPIPSSLRPSFQSISPPRFSSSSRPSFPPPPPFPSTLPPSIPSKTFPPPPSYPPFSFHSTPLPLQPPHFSPPKRPPPPQQNNHLSSKPHGHFDRPFNTGITQHPTFGAKDLNGHFNPTTLGPTHTVLKPRPVFSNIPRHPKPVFVSNNQEHIPSKQLNKPPRFEHFEGTNQDYGHPSNNEIVGRISGIPGVANIDYPAYSFVPKTSFNCIGRVIGYYADPEAECQVFHMCEFGNRHNSFLCPNGTLFSQEILTCDHWRNVDCGRSSNLYHLNQKIYNVQDTITSPYRWKKHAKINLENDQIQNQEDLQARDDPPASHHPPFSSVRSKPENSFPSKKNPLFIITHSRPLGKTFLITTAAPAAFTELLKTNTSFSSSLPHSSTSPPPPPSTSTFSPLPSPPPTPPPPPPPPGVTTVSEEVEFSPEVQSMKPHIVNPLKVKPFLP